GPGGSLLGTGVRVLAVGDPRARSPAAADQLLEQRPLHDLLSGLLVPLSLVSAATALEPLSDGGHAGAGELERRAALFPRPRGRRPAGERRAGRALCLPPPARGVLRGRVRSGARAGTCGPGGA